MNLQQVLFRIKLKIFSDDSGRCVHSIDEIKGELLIISQFTLSADLKKGKKPSYSKAMSPDIAETLYNDFIRISGPILNNWFLAKSLIEL